MKENNKDCVYLKQNKKHENKNKLSIKLKREVRILSQKEINNLLTAKEINNLLTAVVNIETYKKRIIYYKIKSKIKQFIYNCSEWKIIISKNNMVYKISLGGMEKFEYADLDIDYILDDGFSEEEIDQLLFPKDKSEDLL